MVLMFKRRFQQLQIFSEDQTLKEQQSTSKFKILLSTYERKIRVFVVFVISLLIVYSIGIETGKRSVRQLNGDRNSVQIKEEKRLIPTEAKEPIPKKDQIFQVNSVLVCKDESKGYVIQVATYKKTLYAENEALNLKRRGFEAFVKKSGDFIVVYVGGFQTKDEATIYLKKLRKYYSDCFIRKL